MAKTTTDENSVTSGSETAESILSETTSENSSAKISLEASVSSDPIRHAQAMELVNSYVPWSVCAGLVPLPLLDMASLVGVQLRMLSKLSAIYNVPFMKNSVTSIVSSLLGMVISTGFGASLGSVAKTIPFVGPIFGLAIMPGMYSAATYAIGRVFVSHFESGGTFLHFNPEEMRAYFIDEFEKAKTQH